MKRFFGTRYFEGPPVAVDPSKQAYFDDLLSQVRSHDHVADIPWDGRYPKYEFLWYAVERCGLLVRGANQGDLEMLEPIEGKDYFERPVKAVFAASDCVWPMFFALVDRQNPRLRCFWGDAVWAQPDESTACKVYAYAINREAFEYNPYTTGCLYLISGENFQPVHSNQGRLTVECICETVVRPLARMTITTADFPFLSIVQPFTVEDLLAMFEIQAGAVHKVEHGQGASLYYHLERTPLEKIQQAVKFISQFYPGFQVTIGELHGKEVEVRMEFPVGAVRFCKEEWL